MTLNSYPIYQDQSHVPRTSVTSDVSLYIETITPFMNHVEL